MGGSRAHDGRGNREVVPRLVVVAHHPLPFRCGVPGVVDKRGQTDLFGYELRATEIGAADELAASASLMMGQASEGTPIVHVRGFPYPMREARLDELLRLKENDLFR